MTLVGRVVRALDAVHRRYPWSHNDHHLPWVLRRLPPGATRALDVGCGTGNLARALARVVPEVTSLDRSRPPRRGPAAGSATCATCRPPPRTTW